MFSDLAGQFSHTQYVAKLKEDLKQAYNLASQAADKRHKRNRKLYDETVTFQVH